jgi:hypothetical protein
MSKDTKSTLDLSIAKIHTSEMQPTPITPDPAKTGVCLECDYHFPIWAFPQWCPRCCSTKLTTLDKQQSGVVAGEDLEPGDAVFIEDGKAYKS